MYEMLSASLSSCVYNITVYLILLFSKFNYAFDLWRVPFVTDVRRLTVTELVGGVKLAATSLYPKCPVTKVKPVTRTWLLVTAVKFFV